MAAARQAPPAWRVPQVHSHTLPLCMGCHLYVHYVPSMTLITLALTELLTCSHVPAGDAGSTGASGTTGTSGLTGGSGQTGFTGVAGATGALSDCLCAQVNSRCIVCQARH